MKKFVLALAIVIAGCATPTKPNPVYKGPLPDKFTTLEQKNSLLAKELCRLPELQDGITPAGASALEKIVELYTSDPSAFDDAFKKMYRVGLPEVRKYCSPLQAMFWLAEDGRMSILEKVLADYSFGKLMEESWLFGKQATESTGKGRWEDPILIMDRLNSPELFEYWFWWKFSYDWDKLPVMDPYASLQSAEATIMKRKGVCTDAAYLAYVCMKRAGYKATTLRAYFHSSDIRHPLGGFVGHTVCAIERDGSLYLMGDTNEFERTDQPFRNFREAAEYIARFHGASLEGYATGSAALFRLRY